MPGGDCASGSGSTSQCVCTTSATCATRLLDAGVPVKTVSGRLGHARPATTLNIYAHFVPATDRLAADAMGRILSLGEVPATPASPPVGGAAEAGEDGAGGEGPDTRLDQ